MFGHLKRLLKNKALPIQNIMSTWADQSVVQMLKGNMERHAQKLEEAEGEAPASCQPEVWPWRSDKVVVLPSRSTSVALTQSDTLNEIRMWYQTLDTYVDMDLKHTAARQKKTSTLDLSR
jgi:hypothetical protein